MGNQEMLHSLGTSPQTVYVGKFISPGCSYATMRKGL